MASRKFIPSSVKFVQTLSETVETLNRTVGEMCSSAEREILTECCADINEARNALDELKALTEEAASMENMKDKALFCRRKLVPVMEALRKPIDDLELKVDARLWPVPTYGELIFEV